HCCFQFLGQRVFIRFPAKPPQSCSVPRPGSLLTIDVSSTDLTLFHPFALRNFTGFAAHSASPFPTMSQWTRWGCTWQLLGQKKQLTRGECPAFVQRVYSHI
ncbi:hypothetical protein CLAIMM_08789 isoform 4, partial [Cladophialophora immunda]